jgi:hypothetical protein
MELGPVAWKAAMTSHERLNRETGARQTDTTVTYVNQIGETLLLLGNLSAWSPACLMVQI